MSAQQRQAPEPPPHERLRRLAHAVERLGVSGRCTPEDVLLSKLSVAAAMRRLARELEAAR